MCESLDRMREEAKAEGMILGRRDGLIQGKTEGIQIGKEDGILMILTNLLKKRNIRFLYLRDNRSFF